MGTPGGARGGARHARKRPALPDCFFTERLLGVAPGAPCIYLLGTAPGSFDLTPLGLPGCWMNVALPALGTLTAVANPLGVAEVAFALPNAPVFLGDLYSQWLHFDATAAPTPFRAHRGVHHHVE